MHCVLDYGQPLQVALCGRPLSPLKIVWDAQGFCERVKCLAEKKQTT